MRTRFTPDQLADADTADAEAAIRKCVHCGFCLPTCPTYVLDGDERDSPRGRIWMMQDMLENARVPSPETVKHVDRCLSCLSCMTTCPSGVDYRRLVDHARGYIEARYRRPFGERFVRGLLAWVLPSRARFSAAVWLGRTFGFLVPGGLAPPSIKAMLSLLPSPSRGGAGGGGRVVAIPREPLDAPLTPTPTPPRRGEGLRVAMLRGCAEPILEPNIQAAAERLLSLAGYEVVRAAGEGCCGALTHHLGKEAQALASARRNVDAWTAELDRGLAAIIVTASGCSSVIKDYGHMLRGDAAYADKAARVSAAAKDVTEFLAEVGLPARREPMGVTVAHQSPCSLQHGQKITRTPRDLLTAAGFEVRVPAEGHLCCGSAGTYNILQPQIAGRLRERKIETLKATGAQVVASGNIGCIVQLAGVAGLPVVHVVELLDWAHGGPLPAKLGPAKLERA